METNSGLLAETQKAKKETREEIAINLPCFITLEEISSSGQIPM